MTRAERLCEYERQVDRFVKYASEIDRLAILHCADPDYLQRCEDTLAQFHADIARNCAAFGVHLTKFRGRPH
jgi:hypothetical protein